MAKCWEVWFLFGVIEVVFYVIGIVSGKVSFFSSLGYFGRGLFSSSCLLVRVFVVRRFRFLKIRLDLELGGSNTEYFRLRGRGFRLDFLEEVLGFWGIFLG